MPATDLSTQRRDELDSLAIALGGIWVAVAAISLFSPDMVTGSEQQHMPVAAFATWLWGSVATLAVVRFWSGPGRSAAHRTLHRPMAVAVAGVWAIAALVAVFGPVMVTGSDPTRVPFCAIFAPIAATILTALARSAVDLVTTGLLDDPTSTN
ncbi:MAG TPA: hypothetical protein VIL36_14875 [Acidimicrobiales bacterium]